MRGSIRQRGKGSWTVIVDLGSDPLTGKRRQLWRSVKGPKRDAEALLVQLLHERDTGVERPVGKVTVAEYLERWMVDYVTPNLAPKTESDLPRRHPESLRAGARVAGPHSPSTVAHPEPLHAAARSSVGALGAALPPGPSCRAASGRALATAHPEPSRCGRAAAPGTSPRSEP